MRKSHRKLTVWLTLPVAPTGLSSAAVQSLRALLSAGVDLAGVNVMAMDFGSARPVSESMIGAVEEALAASSRQVAAAYRRAGKDVGSQAWGKLGVTPMIGQNDVADEQFTLDAARQLVAFARSRGISRISMWSLNRDEPCGPNVVAEQTVMNSCSGVDQKPLAFARIFGGPAGRTLAVSGGSLDKVVLDDPAKSPYPIWQPTIGYQRGYKVVWHGYVFQSKWWSQDVAPDTPVAHEWATPWQVIGPVLPGEHPPALERLPVGTYPAWSGTVTYQHGERVLVDGLPYEAKWYTRGDPPDFQSGNVWDSPWQPLFTIPGEPASPSGAPPPQSAATTSGSG
jgi:chitinase